MEKLFLLKITWPISDRMRERTQVSSILVQCSFYRTKLAYERGGVRRGALTCAGKAKIEGWP